MTLRRTLTLVIPCLAVMAIAQTPAPAPAPTPAPGELRPIQKVMQARAAWMKAMGQNLADKKFADVAKDAKDLSAQAAKVAGGVEGERKIFHQKVSDLAAAVADAAGTSNEAGIKAKLGEIKATCADCHAKFRDKK